MCVFDPFTCFQEGTLRGRPFSKAQLSKLAAIFNKANCPPRITARRGWPSDQENIAQHPLSRGRGGVPIDGTRNTTLAASIRRLRAIFLVTPPPLLAVMRGGEFALFKMRPPHISLSQPRWTRLSTTYAIALAGSGSAKAKETQSLEGDR